MTAGLGEPKVSHSSKAFWPSANVSLLPSSVRICGGSSETTHTERSETCSDTHRQNSVKEMTGRKQTSTYDIDIRVNQDGAVAVGGLALVDSSVFKGDILQDERSARCQSTSEVLFEFCGDKNSQCSNGVQVCVLFFALEHIGAFVR